MFSSILKIVCHNLRITHGYIIAVPSLHGKRRSQWSGPSSIYGPFHQQCHKSWDSIQGPLYAHGVADILHGEVCKNDWHNSHVHMKNNCWKMWHWLTPGSVTTHVKLTTFIEKVHKVISVWKHSRTLWSLNSHITSMKPTLTFTYVNTILTT